MFFKTICFCLIAVIINVSCHDHNHEEHRVNVTVYYESLCPDSRKFFTQQLYPSLQGNLTKFVNLTLLPYGKATTTAPKTFQCHHGEMECKGNKIQACALRLIDDGKQTPGFGYNKLAVGYINCLMAKNTGSGDQADFPTKECAELNHVPILADIENCANHDIGSQYLEELGKLTDAFMNPLKSVPTITFNQQYKSEDSQLAQSNFAKALCQYIHGQKPVECNGAVTYKSAIGYLVIGFLAARYFY